MEGIQSYCQSIPLLWQHSIKPTPSSFHTFYLRAFSASPKGLCKCHMTTMLLKGCCLLSIWMFLLSNGSWSPSVTHMLSVLMSAVVSSVPQGEQWEVDHFLFLLNWARGKWGVQISSWIGNTTTAELIRQWVVPSLHCLEGTQVKLILTVNFFFSPAVLFLPILSCVLFSMKHHGSILTMWKWDLGLIKTTYNIMCYSWRHHG